MVHQDGAVELQEAIATGRTALGIELGSTRIKACLIGPDQEPIGSGIAAWENQLVDGLWTYPLDSVWAGLQACYADLIADVTLRHGARPQTYGSIGVSAMMHGYLAFGADGELLVPFRTWRNTNTGPAAAALTDLFNQNIPLRWSIAHLYQAILDEEPHVPDIAYLTTLAGYVHWRLTGRRALGVGDASGMFPIDPSTRTYDAGMLDKFNQLVAARHPDLRLEELLPDVMVAGRDAGRLGTEGAALLDPTGTLQDGIPLCPPEGDAGTGMVATNSVAPRTGNVSAGTSIFAMVVLERPLTQVHPEIDLVTTPAGDLVAMVHCNNGASELGAWAEVFGQFAVQLGNAADGDQVFAILTRAALSAEADCGGLLAYNYLAGEPITGLEEGRPMFVRSPDSRLTLPNFARAQLYGVFGTLALGMRVLAAEGAAVDTFLAHGGLFRTRGAAQRMLAGAVGVPIAVDDHASEGGAWGIAVLAAYLSAASNQELSAYLEQQVFADASRTVVDPDPTDVAGFAEYLERYTAGLAIQHTAVESVPRSGPTSNHQAGKPREAGLPDVNE